jgi:reverse gyrase
MRFITQKQQRFYTSICRYCGGTGIDILNKSLPCPHCVLPYVIVYPAVDEEKNFEALRLEKT